MGRRWKWALPIVTVPTIAALFVILAIFPHSSTGAQQAPLLDRDLFFGYPEISSMKLSPDGSSVSFLKPVNGVLNVWVKGVDEPFDRARQISFATERSIVGYSWSRDGKYILYNQDKGGDENGHLFSVDVSEPRLTRDLTPIPNIQTRVVFLPKERPHEVIVGLNDRDPCYHDLYTIDITSGERTLLQRNEMQISDWVFDAHGVPRLAVRATESGDEELYRMDPDGLTLLRVTSKEDTFSPIKFHPDGQRCYCLSNCGVDRTRLILFCTSTCAEEVVDELVSSDVDLDDALFSSETGELIGTEYTDDRSHIHFLNKEWEHDYSDIASQLPRGDLFILSNSADDRRWLVVLTSDCEPGSMYLYDRNQKSLRFFYQRRPDLSRTDLATTQPIHFEARDGFCIHGYLTLPKGVTPQELPLVVRPHGGPWTRDTWGYDGEAQFLANRGYAVLFLNFRGSTGYGKAFLHAGKKQWGEKMQDDITDGVQYLIKRGIVDPKKVAIYGGSYGGYAALAGLAFTPNLYCAGISLVGPSNLLTLLATVPPYWQSARGHLKEYLGDLDNPEDVARLKRQSPLFSVRNIKAPLLVVQGANDPRVKKAESDQIVTALRGLGREVRYLVASDEGHGFLGEENRMAFAVAMEQFFARHLGGRCQDRVREATAACLERLDTEKS